MIVIILSQLLYNYHICYKNIRQFYKFAEN